MQQMSRFTKIAPSLYRLGRKSVYVYLPDTETSRMDETEADNRPEEALELYRRGGLFVYLRYPVEEFGQRLLSLAEKWHGRMSVFFLDNEGDYVQNWKEWGWWSGNHKRKQSRILSICGYDAMIPKNTPVEADGAGIHFQSILFGRERMEECHEAVMAWDGQIRFLFRAGQSFIQEAQIRYELEEYDAVTRRKRLFICNTGEPRLATGDREIWVQAEVRWAAAEETTFRLLGNVLLHITGFPAMEMETCIYQFAKGTAAYYPAVSGNGRFVDAADAPVGFKGFFRIRRGDRVELVILPEGYLGDRSRCAEVSALKVYAPFYAAGIEMESGFTVPVFPASEDRVAKTVKRQLERKVTKGSRPIYHKDICFHGGNFEMCICGRDILWYNLYGRKPGIPGIALCHVGKELACALTADESFVVLDHRARELFTIPYTIDTGSLARAVRAGYPQEESNRLMRHYPYGQVFLREDSFRRGILRADCSYTEQIREACHHYRVSVEDGEADFAPDLWESQGIILAVKKGRTHALQELAGDVGTWSFCSGSKEAVQILLHKLCGRVQEAVKESVVCNPEWEGSIVVSAGIGYEESVWLLALRAGNGAAVFDRIQEKAVSI